MCLISMRFPESVIHALQECEAAKDVWVGSLKILQKGVLGLADFTHLMEYLLDRLELHDMEEVLVQARIFGIRETELYMVGNSMIQDGWSLELGSC